MDQDAIRRIQAKAGRVKRQPVVMTVMRWYTSLSPTPVMISCVTVGVLLGIGLGFIAGGPLGWADGVGIGVVAGALIGALAGLLFRAVARHIMAVIFGLVLFVDRVRGRNSGADQKDNKDVL